MASRFILSGHNIDDGLTPIYRQVAGHPWSFVGAAATAQAPDGLALNVNVPGGVQSGDLLFMGMKSSPDVATPAGWTNLTTGNQEQYWRIADGTATDNFAWPVGTGSDAGRVGVYAAFRPPGTPVILRTGQTRQLTGLTNFIVSKLLVDVGITDTLAVSSTQRNGLNATTTPVFSGMSGGGWIIAAHIYRDWTAFGTRHDYYAMCYKLETDADAIGDENFDYSPYENGSAQGSTGRSFRFNV